MSYLVLARKFRPQAFAEVTGQEHVTRTLGNAIRRNKVAHAYLFAGPRGVGKTSIARIFSKCLNCSEGPTVTPCLQCPNCVGIAQGTSLAVREIDGASHNSVDNVRELIETFRALPAPGSKYKIYIIDEVHMLSVSAFNALLKSLEEPPPHTVFILATTEAHKIPDTVISRCQRHELRALTNAQVEARLREIAATEKYEVQDEVFHLIARLSEGSMRDAQSLLDRVQSFAEGAITIQDAVQVLGVVDRSVLFNLSAATFNRQPETVIQLVQQAFSFGVDPALFLKEFVAHWRELLVAKIGAKAALHQLGVPDATVELLLAQVAGISPHDVQDLAYIGRQAADDALRSTYPKIAFEALLVRMATRERVRDINLLVQELRKGASSAGGGAAVSTPISAPTPITSTEAPQRITPTIRSESTGDAGPRIVRHTNAALAVAPREEPRSALQWEQFVREGSVTGILLEQLKRLTIDEFGPGVLRGRGPEFSVAYLQQKANKEKLEGALVSYARVSPWVISLEVSVSLGDAENSSILHQERVRAERSREEKVKDVADHPKIKTLQKLFPGSTIENIKVKE